MKDPFELAIYPLLFWELRPSSILEIGALDGGSATWMADMLESMQIDGHIHSFDINADRIHCSHRRVTFRHIDANDLTTIDSKLLASLPHPWLVIEDAHQNVCEVLTVLDRFMVSGDYLVVEDTISWKKYLQLRRFLRRAGDSYRVDSKFTDAFGYNATWNINGFLKRM